MAEKEGTALALPKWNQTPAECGKRQPQTVNDGGNLKIHSSNFQNAKTLILPVSEKKKKGVGFFLREEILKTWSCRHFTALVFHL